MISGRFISLCCTPERVTAEKWRVPPATSCEHMWLRETAVRRRGLTGRNFDYVITPINREAATYGSDQKYSAFRS